MSAKIAVLGLVIEEPSPAYRLTAKLRQRLSSAGFVDSNVYTALTRLEREGLICVVKAGQRGSSSGHRPSKGSTRASAGHQQFEATPAGLRFFEEWLLESSSVPPLRDELHMKIAFCPQRDVPRMIDQLHGEEQACLAHVRELRRSGEQTRPPDPDRWSACVMMLVKDAELAFWESRISWLQRVRISLEGADVRSNRANAQRGMV